MITRYLTLCCLSLVLRVKNLASVPLYNIYLILLMKGKLVGLGHYWRCQIKYVSLFVSASEKWGYWTSVRERVLWRRSLTKHKTMSLGNEQHRTYSFIRFPIIYLLTMRFLHCFRADCEWQRRERRGEDVLERRRVGRHWRQAAATHRHRTHHLATQTGHGPH